MSLTISEQLTYSTVKIECAYSNGTTGTGTGYFFRFKEDVESGTHVPVMITNKHVIKDSTFIRLIFCKKDEQGNPLDDVQEAVGIDDFHELCLMHPEEEVDLCAIPINRYMLNSGNLYYVALDMTLIPSDDEIAQLTALEEVVMVGYPIGLWDSKNNKPILRRGWTATHPAKDYCGKKEFMIDAACFPGSSGSPVFILHEGMYVDRRKGIAGIGNKIKLLGTLYAGPQQTVSGAIKIVNVPTSQTAVSFSQIPTHLGLVIKSSRILELEALLTYSQDQ